MTIAEKEQTLIARGCAIVHDGGDWALVYPYANGSKRSHELTAKAKALAVWEAWDWLYPDQHVVERIEIIQRIVGQAFGVSAEMLRNGGRSEPLATARRCAMVLARELTPASLHTIGDAFEREHSGIRHAVLSVADQCSVDERFGARLATLRAACLAALQPKAESA